MHPRTTYFFSLSHLTKQNNKFIDKFAKVHLHASIDQSQIHKVQVSPAFTSSSLLPCVLCPLELCLCLFLETALLWHQENTQQSIGKTPFEIVSFGIPLLVTWQAEEFETLTYFGGVFKLPVNQHCQWNLTFVNIICFASAFTHIFLFAFLSHLWGMGKGIYFLFFF